MIQNNINNISQIIKNGGVALIQVDTIFGLVCLGTNDKAITRIERIKQRTKPSFGFFVKDINIAKKYANFNDIQQQCFNKIFPGYFTLILEANEETKLKIPRRALGQKDNITTIGIRVPKNDVCLEILQNFDEPLVATSANISGKKTAIRFEDIDKSIIHSVDAIYYDKNVSITGDSSTIIDIVDIDKPKIIRNGSGNVELLKDLITF